MWSFPDLNGLVLALLLQKDECPVDRLVDSVRLNILVAINAVSLVQEIAAENAHSKPPRKPWDEPL